MADSGFTGDTIREYFSSDDFDNCVEVVYTPNGGSALDPNYIFLTEKTISNEDTRANFFEVIVGRDHVANPGGGDTFTYGGDTYRCMEVFEMDSDTARMAFEKTA